MDGGLGLRRYLYSVVLRSTVDDFVSWNLCPVFQSAVSPQHHSPATYCSGSATNRPIPRLPSTALPSAGRGLSRSCVLHTQSGRLSNGLSLSSIGYVLDDFLLDFDDLSRWKCTDAACLYSARVRSV